MGSVNPQSVKLRGVYYGDTVTAQRTVYDMSTGKAEITLSDAEKYDTCYYVYIDGQRYTLETEEISEPVKNGVSIRNAVVSEDKESAVVNVYNTTYGQVTATVTGVNPDGGEATAELVIDAESVGSVTVTGTDLNKYTWSVSTK